MTADIRLAVSVIQTVFAQKPPGRRDGGGRPRKHAE